MTHRSGPSAWIPCIARTILTLFVLLGAVGPESAPAQSPPGTDIWIFALTGEGTGLDVSSGIRATDRPGYDNQPGFLPGGRFLLFTRIDETGQADIYRFDLLARAVEPVTSTVPESEYSATVMPSGDRISVIRVEADSTQRLWSFDLEGGSPTLLLPDIQPVGYHAWIDAGRLALFVLGSPATLQIVSVEAGKGEVAARDVGRSVHWVPSRGAISFVQWHGPDEGTIEALEPATGESVVLAPLLEGNEFHAWTPGGTLLMGQGSHLFRWVPGGPGGWEEMADLGPSGVRGISRIAVSPEGDRIAVVGVGG